VAEVTLLLLPWLEGTDTLTLGTVVGAAATMLYLWWRWR
jgi:hypothetical protein